ncbi:MAG: GDP-mannose 4,6-dehydratase [Clostridia bacterium]|nr:GDP-mannose 4,6-dehydratase [Clostridia bacterium]
MRALITGSAGFVGPYLRQELTAHGYEVMGLDMAPAPDTLQANLLNPEAVQQALDHFPPEVIFHLAAQADVGKSWKEPQRTMELNLIAAINLLEAVRRFPTGAVRLVMVGSSDQYGSLGALGTNVTEETPMAPGSPYAISKIAQENMARLYGKAYGIPLCMTRSFNHGGAGQRPGFMIPDFASGIVRVERGEARELAVGNLAARRDFTHVKDMARAYRLIAERGQAGEVYNVGSGITWSAQQVLDKLCKLSTRSIPVRQDPARMRPSDTPVICCNHDKLTRDTGWTPELTLDDILADTLNYYRQLEA